MGNHLNSMKKVLESSARITIIVMLAFAALGLILFGIDTSGDMLGSIADWDDNAQQTAIWVGLTLTIALGIKLYPGSYNLVDENGKVVGPNK